MARGDKTLTYQAPSIFAIIFYTLLVAWTVLSSVLLGAKAIRAEWTNALQWFMVFFVVAYTWYFSVGISYKISLDPEEGELELTSFRRTVKAKVEEIPLVEGPSLPVGFIKISLPREKAYLFVVMLNPELKKVIQTLRGLNREARFKNMPY